MASYVNPCAAQQEDTASPPLHKSEEGCFTLPPYPHFGVQGVGGGEDVLLFCGARLHRDLQVSVQGSVVTFTFYREIEGQDTAGYGSVEATQARSRYRVMPEDAVDSSSEVNVEGRDVAL